MTDMADMVDMVDMTAVATMTDMAAMPAHGAVVLDACRPHNISLLHVQPYMIDTPLFSGSSPMRFRLLRWLLPPLRSEQIASRIVQALQCLRSSASCDVSHSLSISPWSHACVTKPPIRAGDPEPTRDISASRIRRLDPTHPDALAWVGARPAARHRGRSRGHGHFPRSWEGRLDADELARTQTGPRRP
jgi:hypothetical protein